MCIETINDTKITIQNTKRKVSDLQMKIVMLQREQVELQDTIQKLQEQVMFRNGDDYNIRIQLQMAHQKFYEKDNECEDLELQKETLSWELEQMMAVFRAMEPESVESPAKEKGVFTLSESESEDEWEKL